MELQLPAVLAANEAYRCADPPLLPTAEPARGLVVLTCMDARIDLLPALGLVVGDAHVLRNAGGRASEDALRSLVVSTHLLGTREVGVVHHTACGLAGLTAERLELVTGVAGIDPLGFDELDDSVRDDVDVIRGCAALPPGLVSWGGVYDVATGALRVVVEPQLDA